MKAESTELTAVYISHQDAKRLDAAARLYEREAERGWVSQDLLGAEYSPQMKHIAESLAERIYSLDLSGSLGDSVWQIAQVQLSHDELTVLTLGRLQMSEAEAIVAPLLQKF